MMKSQEESEEIAGKSARWTVRRKQEAVLRLLRGESLDELSRELHVPAHQLAQWRDLFLAGGAAGLKSRPTTAAQEALKKAQAKIGELTMKLELYEKKDELLANARRSKRS
ncbi:helix-turn-helix domain-containing protein [Candidatus Acetothermia bacterium]|nr:helix-turn-helix domain-containing protein [Candidatus Acetothermia bacterium]